MEDKFDPLLLENQLCFPLYAVSKALVRQYEPLLSDLNLTYTQYIVMLAMWEKKTLSVNDIGAMVHLDSGTLSPLLQKLEEKGYLEKTRGHDGRKRLISLTEEGANLKEKAKDIPLKIGNCLHLTPDEAKCLYSLCYKTLGWLE